MRSQMLFAVVVLLSSTACGPDASSESQTPEDVELGDPTSDPSLVSLPSSDRVLEQMSEHMRFGWTLAEEALALPMPDPPPEGDAAALTRWADDELEGWLERKSRTVEAARRELDAAADGDDTELIIAGAIVGLIYEDVALGLRSIPVPSELHSDPEIAEIFREVRQSQAKPFLEHARRAYRACAANARNGPQSMAHWSGYCSERSHQLPPSERD